MFHTGVPMSVWGLGLGPLIHTLLKICDVTLWVFISEGYWY